MSVRVLKGDCRAILPTLPAASVQCVVTSPPYWGLRDYGVEGQLGLEPTPEDYVARMVEVFREVRRVLRDDGTLWMNMGDSYASEQTSDRRMFQPTRDTARSGGVATLRTPQATGQRTAVGALKPKDLVGMPWRLAFALQADGWYLRADIIWAKPNPMPESVTDRPTKAHEYVFLFGKGQWRRRTVKFADLGGKTGHLGSNGGTYTPDAWASRLGIAVATAILDAPEFQQHLGGALLQPQVGPEGIAAPSSIVQGGLPSVQGVTRVAARLLHGDATAKEFLCELHRIGLVLREQNKFLIRGSDTEIALPPPLHRYGEASIAVHDSGQIGEVDFLHGHIVAHTATTCSYFYDADAVREPSAPGTVERFGNGNAQRITGKAYDRGRHERLSSELLAGRNLRSVWTIPSAPFPEAHFATFPPALASRCIQAGTSEKGACGACGAPWVRRVERGAAVPLTPSDRGRTARWTIGDATRDPATRIDTPLPRHYRPVMATGWQPTCACDAASPYDFDCAGAPSRNSVVPCTVLDPFGGSGTVGAVAEQLGRHSILIELSPAYVQMAEERTAQRGLFTYTPESVGAG